MVKMEIAKFMFRFKNKMLPISFDNYFTILLKCTNTILDKKIKVNIIIHLFNSEFGRKRPNHERLKLWKSMSLAEKECSFSKFKKCLKIIF